MTQLLWVEDTFRTSAVDSEDFLVAMEVMAHLNPDTSPDDNENAMTWQAILRLRKWGAGDIDAFIARFGACIFTTIFADQMAMDDLIEQTGRLARVQRVIVNHMETCRECMHHFAEVQVTYMFMDEWSQQPGQEASC